MSLTEKQVRAIKKWSEATRYVSEVRLYGSQATGLATDRSDIDLAITIEGADRGNTVLGIYFRFADEWQDDLTRRLGTKVHLGLYNDVENGTGIVRRSCDECSVVLFP